MKTKKKYRQEEVKHKKTIDKENKRHEKMHDKELVAGEKEAVAQALKRFKDKKASSR
jgi:hypothetical protein